MVFTFSDPTTWSDADFTNGNLSTTALASMTATIASQITSSQMGKFSAAQIAAFPTSTVSSIVAIDGIDASAISSIADFSSMIEAQIKLLTNPQIYALASNKKLTSFSTTQLGYLTFAQTKQLTYSYTVSNSDTSGIAQLKDLSYLQVRALSHITHAEILTTEVISEQLSTSTSYWMQKLSASQLGSLSTAQFTAIVAAQFGYFSATQMAGFTSTHMTNLSLAQFQAITGTSGTGTNDATDSLVSAISGITTTAIDDITASHFASITESQLGALTTSQIAVLTNSQVSNLPGSAVSSSVPSTSQMAAFTISQVYYFASGIGNFFNLLSASQVNALTEDSGVSRISNVSTAAINYMKPSVIHGLDATTTGSLTSTQLAVLDTYTSSYDQVQALNVADLKSNIVYLSSTQISNLTYAAGASGSNTSTSGNGQIGDLTTSSPNQIDLLSSTNSSSNLMVAGFTVDQIHVVSNNQFAQIHANAFAYFSAAQIAAFQNVNIHGLSASQFAKITSTNIAGFRYTKVDSESVSANDKYGWIQAISTDRIKELTSSQFSGLTTSQIPGLSLDQVANLPSGAVSSSVPSQTQIQSFTVSGTTATNSVVANQVANLPAAYVSAFAVAQLNYFTTTQFAQLSQAAIKILSNTQLAGLDIDHVGALTKSQLITLDSTDSNYNAWTATTSGQVASLTASYITAAQLSNSTDGFADAQISNFSSSQTVVFSSTQLASIVSSTRLNKFNAGNFQNTLPLTAWQISILDSTNMGRLTVNHLASLTTAQKVAAITITAINSTKVSSLDPSKLTTGANTSITPTTAESELGASAKSVIPQIEFMSEAQVQALTISGFTEAQVQALHMPYVSASQIATLSKIGYLSVQGTSANALAVQNTLFSTNSSITSGVISVTASDFSSKRSTTQGQIEQMSDSQIRGFTTSQIPKLTGVQLADFTQQQMKYFTDNQVKCFSSSAIYKKDGTTSDATDYVNQFAAMGENLLHLPYSQYALVRTAITSGMSDNQKAKENDYHLLARAKTVTTKLASVISALTANDTTYDINAKSSFSVINALPAGLLHMLNAEQVALLNADNISLVKSTDITTISANANYANMSKEAQDVLANNILGSTYNDWSSLATYVNSSAYGYTPSTASNYTYPPLDVLGAMSNSQVTSLKGATLVKMYANAIDTTSTANRLVQINAISNLSNLGASEVNTAANDTDYGADLLSALASHLTNTHFSELSAAVVQKFTATAWANISAANIAVITSAAFATGFERTAIITSTQATGMTTAQLNALHNIGSLSSDAVAAAFSASNVTVSSISDTQIQALGAKIVNIAANKFSSLVSTAFASPFANAAVITDAQAAVMTTNQLNALNGISSLQTTAVAAAFSSSNVTVSSINASQIQALGAKIANIAANKFSSLVSTAFASPFANAAVITDAQAAVMTTAQLNALNGISSLQTTAVAAAFSSSNVTVSSMSASQIQALGAKIAYIAANKFSSLVSTAFASPFANTASITSGQAMVMTASQVSNLPTTQIEYLDADIHMANFPVATFSGFSLAQIQEMSTTQINASPALGKRRLMLVLDGSISAMDIDLTGFNTAVLAGLLSSLKQEEISISTSDATVQVKLSLSDAQSAFKYAYGTDGNVRMYVDKSKFNISYNYASTAAVTVQTAATVNSTVASGLKWIGPVTTGTSISGYNDPLSWDFINHVAKETYGNYRFSALFTDVISSEQTLCNNINGEINDVVATILDAFDVSNSAGSISSVASGVSFTKYGSAGDYYTILDATISSSNNDKYNIPSTIHTSLYSQQPERFTSATSETADPTTTNEKQSMPFVAGDTLNFLLTITPANDQRVLDTKLGMGTTTASNSTTTGSGARVDERTYKMQIVITA